MMKKNEQRDLSCIAHDIGGLNAVIGLTQNYISCVQLQATKAKDNNDCSLILWSSTNEKGFENIMSNLEILSKKIESLADEVLGFSDEVSNR